MQSGYLALDLFGTTCHLLFPQRPYRDLCRRLGADPEAFREAVLTSNLSLTEFARKFSREAVKTDDLELALATEIQSTELYPEVPAALDLLHQRGWKIAVISNLAAPYVAGVERLLPAFVTVRLWSCAEGVAKPDRTIFARACARLGCAPAQLMVVGDSLEADVAGAIDAGCHGVWMDRKLVRGAPPRDHDLVDTINLSIGEQTLAIPRVTNLTHVCRWLTKSPATGHNDPA